MISKCSAVPRAERPIRFAISNAFAFGRRHVFGESPRFAQRIRQGDDIIEGEPIFVLHSAATSRSPGHAKVLIDLLGDAQQESKTKTCWISPVAFMEKWKA